MGSVSSISLAQKPIGVCPGVEDPLAKNSFYKRQGQKIHFEKHLLKGADPKSLCALSSLVAKDRHQVYVLWVPVQVKDVSSFALISGMQRDSSRLAARDKKAVYVVKVSRHRAQKGKNMIREVRGADPRSFRLLINDDDPSYYAVDQRRVYFFDVHGDEHFGVVPKADPGAFTVGVCRGSWGCWGKDRRRAFEGRTPLPFVHVPSFTFVGLYYAKDRRRVYQRKGWQVIKGADTATFQTVRGRGVDAVDKRHQYKSGRRLK